MMSGGPIKAGIYLERLVERKKIEVNALLKLHQDPADPIFMRMAYISTENKFNVTRSVKSFAGKDSDAHKMTVMVDMKRKSPTVPTNRNIVEFSRADKFCELLTLSGADSFLINTDEFEYGGTESDLKDCIKSSKLARPDRPPAIIHKDIIIHPVQIAKAVEQGASGVLLITAVVGSDLEVLLDACTIMGTEAVVEVHTPNELDFALSRGATIFLVNMWDRMTGQLFPDQAKGLASMLPMNAVSIAAGNICSLEHARELGYFGYDSVVLGRGITTLPDIKGFIDGVHEFQGPPRGLTAGMRGMPWAS
jgi:indole-3-glycerol phosphate synthase